MIKYFIIAFIAITQSTASFSNIRGNLKKASLPLAAAAGIAGSKATGKTHAQVASQENVNADQNTVQIPKKSHELTIDEVIEIFIRNAH